MSRGRKHGCPTNIRSWLISALDRASGEWVRIYGLTGMTRTLSGETSDGSAGTDIWEEPYVSKRKATLKLEGVIVEDETSGERDPGQQLLDAAGLRAGCEEDLTLRLVDPYGHSLVADFVVTGQEQSHDDTKTQVSWDLEQVGEAEEEPYVHVQAVHVTKDSKDITELALKTGDGMTLLGLRFEPENASNRRFRVYNSAPGVVRIAEVTPEGFCLQPQRAGTAVIRVETLNQGRDCSVRVQVEE